MKILIIIGSARKNGNTSRVMRLFKEQLYDASSETDTDMKIDMIYLAEQNIQQCKGCRLCFDKGEESCPLKDDLLSIRAKMTEADAVIFASPVYVEDVSGTMKNFIDRLAFICHRPEFAGKTAFCVVTTGMTASKHSIRTMSYALSSWGFLVIGDSWFKTGALTSYDDIKKLYEKRIKDISDRIKAAVVSIRAESPSFMALMIFCIQQHYMIETLTEADEADYRYWKEKGWLDPKTEYYINHRASRIKVILARFTGSLIKKLVL
ncbi:MAG: flavodoxin family protein [Bacillota bacterium]